MYILAKKLYNSSNLYSMVANNILRCLFKLKRMGECNITDIKKTVKKGIIVLLVVAIAFISFWSSMPNPINNMHMFINNQQVQFNGNLGAPMSENNRTLVPIRVISESMGYKVGWDQEAQKVTVSNTDRSISLIINNATAVVNGKGVKMDTKAQVIKNRTYVPLRFVSENMGATVDYKSVGGSQYVYITLPGGPEPEVPAEPVPGQIPGTAGADHEANMEAIRNFFGEDLHSKGTVALNPIGGTLDNSFVFVNAGDNSEVEITITGWYTSTIDKYAPEAVGSYKKINPTVKEILHFYLPNGYNNLYKIIDDGFNNRWAEDHNYTNQGTNLASKIGSDGRVVVMEDYRGLVIKIGSKK